MNSNSLGVLRRTLLREVTAALLVGGLLLQSAVAVAPDWWTVRGVLLPNATADDYAVANVGQLKHIAKKAALEMNARLVGGAGAEIHALLESWAAPNPQRDDYAALNAGQLKHVAALFHERLAVAQLTPQVAYPWGGGLPADDFALVNLGQLKAMFGFPVPQQSAPPGPLTIPAALLAAALAQWNALPVKPLGSSADDFDGDGIANLQEYLMGNALFNPLDLDGDRILDSIEDAHPGILSKLDFTDAVRDHDEDGVMNFEEVLLGLNLNGASTSGRMDGLTDAEVLAWGLLGGTALAPSTDAVRACWQVINEDWISFHASGNEHWLEATLVNGEPAGLTAFRAEFWGPDVWPIQNPPEAVDLNGDGMVDPDHDGDYLPDLWEYRYAFDLRDWQDVWDDPDEDTLDNSEEYAHGTHPRLADTDGDGYADNVEIQAGSLANSQESTPAHLPLELAVVGGWSQSVLPGAALAEPLVVKATRGGIPWPGVLVRFAAPAGVFTATAVVTQADGTASGGYRAAAQPLLWDLTLTASAGAAETHFSVKIQDVDSDGDGWTDRLEQQYGSSTTSPGATPATQSPGELRQWVYYDTDSLLADDQWWLAEDTDPPVPAQRWQATHSWHYLGDWSYEPGSHASRPSTPLRGYPQNVTTTESFWQPVGIGLPWRADAHDAVWLGPYDRVPNEWYLPIANRWNQSESGDGWHSENLGWGLHWKRYRIVVPGPLPVDYAEHYLQVTYQWDKNPANAVWVPDDVWDIYSDGYWTYPPPTIKAVETVQLKLQKDATEGDWLYVLPTAEDNELVSVHLLPVEIVQPVIAADGNVSRDTANKQLLAPVSSIRTSRWGQAYASDLDSTFFNLFHNIDHDRLHLRVKGIGSNVFGSILKIGVTGINGTVVAQAEDDPNGITFEQSDSDVNVWLSNALLLVCDHDDDGTFNGSAASDDLDQDATHLASSGANINITIGSKGAIAFPVSEPKYDITIRPIVLTYDGHLSSIQIDGVEMGVKDEIENDLKKAREVYRQIGVNIKWEPVSAAVEPQEVTDALGDSIFGMTDEQQEHMLEYFDDVHFPRDRVITVYYTRAHLHNAMGVTWMYDGPPWNDPLRSFAVIGFRERHALVLAHEIGHVLGLDHVVPGQLIPHRLMTDAGMIYEQKYTDSKRFSRDEVAKILKSKFTIAR